MTAIEHIAGSCPKCGEALQIPAHLKQFSCIYCGARLTPCELVTDSSPDDIEPDVDAAAALQYYRDHVLEVITNHIGIHKQMTRSDYVPSFEQYARSNEETFRQLDQAVSAGLITAQAAASEFLDQLEGRWNAPSSPLTRRSMVMDTDKFVIAIFLVPMIRRMNLSVSEAYCLSLQEQWVARHPKSPFYLGDYEELSTGFNRKIFGLCFITTAVCRNEGKPDDCAELTAFRAFRDGYLRACPDGPALIDEYYNVAPGIVLRIDLSHDRDARYTSIRRRYLEPCYEDLRAGRLQQCKERYTAMMHDLEQEYLH